MAGDKITIASITFPTPTLNTDKGRYSEKRSIDKGERTSSLRDEKIPTPVSSLNKGRLLSSRSTLRVERRGNMVVLAPSYTHPVPLGLLRNFLIQNSRHGRGIINDKTISIRAAAPDCVGSHAALHAELPALPGVGAKYSLSERIHANRMPPLS